MYLIAPAAKFGYDVLRKELGIAARHIHVGIGDMQQSVEHILKLIEHLHLIKQYIIRLVIDNPALHVVIELVGIAEFLESVIIESHFHDMVVCHSIILKKPSE